MNQYLLRLINAAKYVYKGQLPYEDKGIIRSITVEEVDEARTFFPMQKFFVFGHARSGTTLLARLIRVHPEIHCNWQGHYFSRPPYIQDLVSRSDVFEWMNMRSNRWNRQVDPSPVVLRSVIDYLLERDARVLGKSIVGDKSPNNLSNGKAVENLHRIFPDAKLIYISRDGRDAVLSHRFQNFIDAPQRLSSEDLHLRDTFAKDPAPFHRGERSIFTEKGIRKSAKGWVKNLTETHRQGTELFGENYLKVRYEDVLVDPFNGMKKIWSFLGGDISDSRLEDALQEELSKNPDADWQRQKESELVSKVRKGKSGSWRELFTLRDRKIFKDVAGSTLVEWGYEEDINW